MIKLDFRTKPNGLPIVSKVDIEYLAKMLIEDYNSNILHTPSTFNVESFSEFYIGLDVDYKDLTYNQSIIGMMVFNDCSIEVYDTKESKNKRILVDEGTILIDNSLLEPNLIRRGRFTICHEVAHWILHQKVYMVDKNQMSLFDQIEEEKPPITKCRTTDIESNNIRELITDNDWMEWQADYMASALLMPKSIFIDVVRKRFNSIGIESGYYRMGTNLKTDLLIDSLSYELSSLFDVSIMAVKIRLKNLNLIKEYKSIEQLHL